MFWAICINDGNETREKTVTEIFQALLSELALWNLERNTGILQQRLHFVNVFDVAFELRDNMNTCFRYTSLEVHLKRMRCKLCPEVAGAFRNPSGIRF